MKAIIPTGGRGTRMQPLTFSINKHFIPIVNKPLIFYPIEAIASAGIKEVAITYNPGWFEFVKNSLGDGSKWGLKFTYVIQDSPVGGLANIFQVCEEYLAGESFVMHLGDNIFTGGIKTQVDYFLNNKPDGLVTMVHHPENSRMGVPYFNKNGRLVKYVEKPKSPPHDFAIPGLYFFNNKVFGCFSGGGAIKPSSRGEYEISSPYQWLIDHGFRVDVTEYKDKWLDPGKFDDWLTANRYLLDVRNDFKVTSKCDSKSIVEGRVEIGKNCSIKNSTLRGPLVIGNNVHVTDSYIGPYSSVSDDCILEDCSVENAVLMESVTIKKVDKVIDTSLIGPGVKIESNHSNHNRMMLFIGAKSVVNF